MPGIETFLIATVLAWGWTGLDSRCLDLSLLT